MAQGPQVTRRVAEVWVTVLFSPHPLFSFVLAPVWAALRAPLEALL